MKYALLCIAAAGFLAAGNAQMSLGLDVSSSLQNYSQKVDNYPQSNNSHSDFTLSAGPIFRIPLEGDRELDPYAELIFSNSNNAYGYSSQLGFLFGCGYFYQMAHVGILTFSLGPDLSFDFYLPPSNSGSDYSHFDINAGVPLNFDFDFSRKLSIRIRSWAFTIGYSHDKATGTSNDIFNYSLQSILFPSFTFFYTF
jgi:hypothetical protein